MPEVIETIKPGEPIWAGRFEDEHLDQIARGLRQTHQGHAKHLARELLAARKALRSCAAHIEELRDAWQRGAISEHDGMGGTRSNRNTDTLLQARAVLAGEKELQNG